jgi:hypothetical protein
LEEVSLSRTEIADVSPLATLPRLRKLQFGSSACKDLRPLGRCTSLRDLRLNLLRHWPDVRGIGDLPELEMLHLEGNLLVFERAVFRKAKFARLKCEPLEARSVRDLPQVPECEFLSLGGVETLEGLEAFPKLRNFTLESATESFEPLTRMQHLTCVTAQDFEPLDVAPLVRVPGLQFVCFNTGFKTRVPPIKPRDLAPLVEAPALRELEVLGNKLLTIEAGAIQAGLPFWDDLYLLPEPRPLPPWRLVACPYQKIPLDHQADRSPGAAELVDLGLRRREVRWAQRLLERAIDRKLGTTDWWEREDHESFLDIYGSHFDSPPRRSIDLEFQSFGLLDKIPLVAEVIRETLARLRPAYHVALNVRLRSPRLKPTRAQIELEKKRQRERDDEEYEREHKEREDYLERLHRYELSKQQGAAIKPEEFAPAAPTPPADPAPEEDEDDDTANEADVAVKKKPDPAEDLRDEDEHPHAEAYRLHAHFILDGCYVPVQQKGVAEYLFRQPCNEVIQDDERE